MTVAALVVGAGRGERLRASLQARSGSSRSPGSAGVGVDPGLLDLPKAFVLLAGRPLILYALAAVAAAPEVDLVVPVVSAADLGRLGDLGPALAGIPKLAPAVVGGAERQDSVRGGLEALPPEVTHVAVHDAARPLVRPQDVSRVVRAALEHGAALLGVPVRDTLKRVRDGRVVETPPRSEFWAAQTPQVARVDWLREGLAKAEIEGVKATDDAALVEWLLAGQEAAVHMVEGDPENLKITSAEDLLTAEAWLRERTGP